MNRFKAKPGEWSLLANRSGVLTLCPRRSPRGVIAVFHFRDAATAEAARVWVEGGARQAHDGRYYLVPGVPEARSADEAFDQLCAWADRVALRLADKLEAGSFIYLRSAMP